MFRLIPLMIAFCLSMPAFGQVHISGMVVDSMSFKSLPNVHVQSKKTRAGVVSDESGFFKITAMPFDTLVFSRVGYFPFEFVVVIDEEDILIMMKEEVTYLLPVLVTGKGIQSPLIKEKEELPVRRVNALPMVSGSGIAFDYFSRAQREKRKLLKVIDANERVKAYTLVITDPEFKDSVIRKNRFTEDEYYELILTFNVTRISLVEGKEEDEVIEIMDAYFCSQSGRCQ
jgi:hypothetical protein